MTAVALNDFRLKGDEASGVRWLAGAAAAGAR